MVIFYLVIYLFIGLLFMLAVLGLILVKLLFI